MLRTASKQRETESAESELCGGLSRRQRTFILEKLVGLNDKDAALAAGFSLSMAENTKQKVWRPQVRREFERLSEMFQRQVREMPLKTIEGQARFLS